MNIFSTHGGDLEYIQSIYKIPKNEIIDFSGNINPLGVPNSVKQCIINNIQLISTYPDKNYKNLKESIASYTNSSIENIIVGNGSTELISLCIKNINPENSLIISPAYSEYKRTLSLLNKNFTLFHLEEKEDFRINFDKLFNTINSSKNIQLIIICNPNNPTGSTLNNAEIKKILDFIKPLGINIMIDETYVEFSEDTNNISSISITNIYANLFVIRGTSKFFACPGIRLGYLISSNKKIMSKILKHKDLWSVNTLANIAGISMFNDSTFINKSINLINNERNFLIEKLSAIDTIKIYKTQANFILIKILKNNINSTKIYEKLLESKILIRDAKSFEFLDNTFFRICILTHEKNILLIEKLKEILI